MDGDDMPNHNQDLSPINVELDEISSLFCGIECLQRLIDYASSRAIDVIYNEFAATRHNDCQLLHTR